MSAGRRNSLLALGLILLFFLGFALTVNLPVIHKGFLSADQATYFAMTLSIARDLDIEYTNKDLIRYYTYFDAGPQGLFLKKTADGKLFYAKSFAYPLFAAPWVRVFGANGHFVFHAVLLAFVLYLGFLYFSRFNPPFLSLATVLTFLFASVAGVYFVWMTPDFFNFCLVFLVLFLWLYKNVHPEPQSAGPNAAPVSGFLYSGASDYLAAFLAGIMAFSKPSNVALMGPLVLWVLLKKKFGRAVVMVLLFALAVGLFFGTNATFTGDWNYQGGDRKSFIRTFPLEKDGATFDSLGHTMTSEGYLAKLYPVKFIAHNLFWYFFGRFTGLAWYFFPALLALILFLAHKKKLHQWLLFAALAGEILLYLVLMPDNYGGGGGTLANRYFLNIYPLFIFLPPVVRAKKEITLSWAVAAVFIAQILLNPFQASDNPAMHAKRLPFTLLPLEMTQVNEFPTNTNPDGFRVPAGQKPNNGYLYMLNDNFHPKTKDEAGLWTRGTGAADMILKTYFPAREIVVRLANSPRLQNMITVTVEGQSQKVTLGAKQAADLVFPVGDGFTIKAIHLYRIKVKAAKHAIPYFENEDSLERRNLGVFFSFEIRPRT